MAEFTHVIKDASRMCDYFMHHGGHDNCPLFPACNMSQCRKIAFERPEDFEQRVMAWAAAHPKPIYPTWGTWLATEFGYDLREIMYEPIPADIAEKLGIEPKTDSERKAVKWDG